jgi:hypothetical protein
VLVTGDGDRAMARAKGDARRVMDQSAGDSLAATPWADEQVLKVWLTIRTWGQRGEARDAVAAVHDGDRHSGATLGDPVAGEHQVLRTSQQCRRVPGVRQRGRPEHPLQLGQIRFNRSTDDRPVAAGVTIHQDSPLRATTRDKRIPAVSGMTRMLMTVPLVGPHMPRSVWGFNGGILECMTTLKLPTPASGSDLPFNSMAAVVVAAFLGCYRGLTRQHTASDLRCFLAWCAGNGLDPLTARRSELELFLRWMQDTRRFKPSTVSRRFSVVAGFYRPQ